jgi:hypothetical protein
MKALYRHLSTTNNIISSIHKKISTSYEFESKFHLLQNSQLSNSDKTSLLENTGKVLPIMQDLTSKIPEISIKLFAFKPSSAKNAINVFSYIFPTGIIDQILRQMDRESQVVCENSRVGNILRNIFWKVHRISDRNENDLWKFGRWMYSQEFWHFVLYHKLGSFSEITSSTEKNDIMKEISEISDNFRFSVVGILFQYFEMETVEKLVNQVSGSHNFI